MALSAAKGDGPFSPDRQQAVESEIRHRRQRAYQRAPLRASTGQPIDSRCGRIGGYGTGNMTIAEQDATPLRTASPTPMKTDIDMSMAAIGARGTVLDANAGDALDLAVRKSDALWLTGRHRTRRRQMAAADATVTRLRLIVDASRAASRWA